jgi:hypothetical protein
MTSRNQHPIEVLNARLETLRHRLIDHFGSPDDVPQEIKVSFLGVAVYAAELAEHHLARSTAVAHHGIRA